jgi:hypothetical protein
VSLYCPQNQLAACTRALESSEELLETANQTLQASDSEDFSQVGVSEWDPQGPWVTCAMSGFVHFYHMYLFVSGEGCMQSTAILPCLHVSLWINLRSIKLSSKYLYSLSPLTRPHVILFRQCLCSV